MVVVLLAIPLIDGPYGQMDWVAQAQPYDPTATTTPTFTLTPTMTLTATLTPTATTAPTNTPTPTPTPTKQAGTCQIEGKAMLQGRDDSSGIVVRVGGHVMATTNSAGYFIAYNVPTGNYEIRASHLGYLSSVLTSTTCEANGITDVLDTTLLGGDSDNNKQVDLLDLVRVGVSFSKCEGDEWYIPEADINASHCVDIFDLVLVGANYGRTAPTDWPTTIFDPTTAADISEYVSVLHDTSDFLNVGDALLELTFNNISDVYGLEILLEFDSRLINIVDADGKAAGTQIALAPQIAKQPHFMAQNVVQVDPKTGVGVIKIAFTMLQPAKPLKGTGLIASVPYAIVKGQGKGVPAFTVNDIKLVTRDNHMTVGRWKVEHDQTGVMISAQSLRN